MKIFAISGLGADQRIFEYLTLEYDLIPVEWIKPNPKEPIIEYSKRLIKKYKIGEHETFGILGVSFGGLIATEISKLVTPKFTILISSVATRNELSGILKFIGRLKLIEVLPAKLLNPPKPVAYYMFGTQNKALLNAILDATDLNFTKWALSELVTWKNETQLHNLIKICGTEDKLLPAKGDNAILIEKGQHFMIVDCAKEISDIINSTLKTSYSKDVA